jgi:tuberculosinol/isotuberculosinol synthase
MFFDHGLDTLLTPVFGPDLLERGGDYGEVAIQGLLWFAQAPEFLEFYDQYEVRVRVYGDVERHFRGTPYEPALLAFDELSRRTASHRRHRLFFGVCAHDATETVAEIGVRFYQEQGSLPDRKQIVEAYYGEYVDPVDLFIGFERPNVFDMPLLATGAEDLYFTVSPSPYLTPAVLRAILYDHLYTRRVDDADYGQLSPGEWRELGRFYALNRESVLGLGCRRVSGKFWCPVPQVKGIANSG